MVIAAIHVSPLRATIVTVDITTATTVDMDTVITTIARWSVNATATTITTIFVCGFSMTSTCNRRAGLRFSYRSAGRP